MKIEKNKERLKEIISNNYSGDFPDVEIENQEEYMKIS